MALIRWIRRNPLIATGICFAIGTIPQWISSVWSLFMDEPLVPWLIKQGVPRLEFSAWWITGPLGMAMFAVVIWIERRVPFISQAKLKSLRERRAMAQTQTDAVTPYSQMTNSELRAAGKQFVERLRRFISEGQRVDKEEREKEQASFRRIPPGAENEEQRRSLWRQNSDRMTRRIMQFNESFRSNFMVDARLLDQALRRKVDAVALVNSGTRLYTLYDKALDGSWVAELSIQELADHLEALYKQLPPDSPMRL